MLLSQLLCTLSCILLTSLISISFQHIQPSPAMNQNLEGSLFPVLRKKPFDNVVMDARQSRLGWVAFLDWHYIFMMQTSEEARTEPRVWRGARSEPWLGGVWLRETWTVALFVLPVETKGHAGKMWHQASYEELVTVKLCHYLWAPGWIGFSWRKVSGLMIMNIMSLW